MKVNPDKFQCIVFRRKDNLGSFKIDVHDIIPDDVVNILGLHLDNNLNFDVHVHISKLCKKKQATRYVLDYVMLLTSQVRCYYIIVLLNAILTIVQLWHFCSKYNTYKIENLQKKSLRFITINFNSSYKL